MDVLRSARDEYGSNADRAITLNEFRKASELMWGAITQQLKMLAATHNITFGRHKEIVSFVRQVAEEQKDTALYRDFIDMNALHRNFYDEVIPPDAFPEYYAKYLSYMGRLNRLMPTAAQ